MLALAVAFPLSSRSALGQAPSDSGRADSAGRRIDPVIVTGTRAPAAAGGAAALVVVPDSLRVPPAPTLDVALREVPFVLVRQNSRGEAELSLRGSDSRQAAVLVDGLPLTLGWDHRADPSLVPLTGARRIAIVRGIGTLLAGPNVLGGVVEVDLAGALAPAGRAGSNLALAAGVDQYGARSLSAVVGSPARAGGGTVLFSAGGAYRQREGFAWAGGGRDRYASDAFSLRANTDLRHVDGFASLRYDRPGGAYVGATVSAYDAERGVAPELHVQEPRLWRYPDVARQLAIVTAGTGPVALLGGYGRFTVSAGVNGGAVSIESFESARYDVVAGRERGEERTATVRGGATHVLPSGLELRAGVTAADVRYDESLDDDPASRYRQRLVSGGLEAELPLAAGARVAAGVVRDRASTPETGGRTMQPPLSRWGWRTGITVPLHGERLRLHAALSRRSRFPALRELYSGALNRFEPNPSLRPETLTSLEAGGTIVRARGSGSATTFQAAAFTNQLKDAVVRITTPERMFRRINRDELRSTGIELLAEWRSSDGPRNVTAGADLLVQRVRVTDRTIPAGSAEARQPEHQPELRASADLRVPLPLGVRGELTGRYFGRQYCQHPDLGRQVGLDAQSVADASLVRTWRLAARGVLQHLRTVLALDNVGDTRSFEQCGLPRPGRTLRIAVELR